MIRFLTALLFLCQAALALGQVAPTVVVWPVTQGTSVRMAPHACFVYINTTQSIVGAGDWHDCKITWSVTRGDGSFLPETIDLVDPRPQAPADVVNTRTGQKGYVCWYTFENAGIYRFTATVTNSAGLMATGKVWITVVADTRRYCYVDPTAGLDSNTGLSPSAPVRTWQKAIAGAGSNSGVLLKAGSVVPTGADWDLSGINNVRVDIYGGTAPATLSWNAAETTGHCVINIVENCQNILVRNVNFTGVPSLDGGVTGVSAGNNCQNVSVVNSIGTGLRVSWGGSVWSAASDGFAVVNCTAVNPGVNSVFVDGFSDIAVLGLRVLNNQYSHVLRFGGDAASAARASVGYSDCNDNYAPSRPDDRHPFRSYMPLVYSYNDYFRNGVVSIEGGLACPNNDHRVFDACYFKNGKSGCVSLYGGVNKTRFSGCVFEIENNRRSGAAPGAPDNGYSALYVGMDAGMSGLIIEGATVLVGDYWAAGPTQPLFLFTGPGVLSNSTINNVLLVYGKVVAGQTKTFSGPIADIPSSGISFNGGCWPAAAGSPFVIGGTSYTAAQWASGAAGAFVKNNTLESNDRNALVSQGLRPSRALQPLASVGSVAARPSFTDYFGCVFNSAGGRCGSAVGCPADFNGDGFLDPLDYNAFVNAFEGGGPGGDYNGDGFLDPLDYNGFINDFQSGC